MSGIGKTEKVKPWKPAKCPKDCIYRGREYHGEYAGCNYLGMTGELRGCDPGEGCSRYRPRHGKRQRAEKTPIVLKGSKGPRPGWDTKKGRELWQQGRSVYEIAQELGISKSAVQDRKKRYWEKGQT